MKQDQISITRSCSTNHIIIPSNYTTPCEIIKKPFVSINSNNNNNSSRALTTVKKTRLTLSTFFRSLFHVFSFSTSPSFGAAVPTCRWLAIPSRARSSVPSPYALGRKVTGTLFGHRKGHVTFAVQEDPRADPALLIELAVSTSALVQEMSSGLVRIALECERASHAPTTRGGKRAAPTTKLFSEPVWTMYCNGRKCGYATSRACTEFDSHVLSTIQRVSVGAGVIPLVGSPTETVLEGELLYMRAKFERVVGNRDSEAFYMLNPDGNGGPELSIFLLRL
ncbi:hypothetical protein RND81_12G005900 [Saponaria officinalis]|uniref:Protein MIZU-KUSSEI 1 n=1 Tax=Saponaria officinalis TaxID=3572 RepID=A0AAW1H1V3_SAPOF